MGGSGCARSPSIASCAVHRAYRVEWQLWLTSCHWVLVMISCLPLRFLFVSSKSIFILSNGHYDLCWLVLLNDRVNNKDGEGGMVFPRGNVDFQCSNLLHSWRERRSFYFASASSARAQLELTASDEVHLDLSAILLGTSDKSWFWPKEWTKVKARQMNKNGKNKRWSVVELDAVWLSWKML